MDIWGCIIKGGDTGKDSYQNHIFSFLFFQCLIPWDRILRMETLFQSIFASEGIYNLYNNNNNKVCIDVVRKRKRQKCTRRRHLYHQLDLNIPRQEVEITNSINLLQRQTSNRQQGLSDGSSFLFCLKGFKTFTRYLTSYLFPIKNGERDRETERDSERERDNLIF